jgi:Holliday junction resolvase RusA-like endonuclease
MTQQFTFVGVPKAQGRPKFARRGKFVTAYDPKDSAQYKNNVAAQIVAQNPVLIPQGVPVKLSLLFILPRPKYHYSANGVLKPRFESTRHVTKPDSDNLEKAVKDAMTGIVWHDDSQVDITTKEKKYGEEPRVVITVESEV